MILYYALGAGLGHLTRARAVLHTLGLDHDAAILTNSRFADNQAVSPNFPALITVATSSNSSESIDVDVILQTIHELRPTELFIDAFPCGLYGELTTENLGALGQLPVTYIGRLIRWQRYAGRITLQPVRFQRSIILEELSPEHEKFVNDFSLRIERLKELTDPPPESDPGCNDVFDELASRHFWLIFHSGPEHEIEELVAYAEDMRRIEHNRAALLIVTPGPFTPTASLPDNCRFACSYPIDKKLLERAERIITACGFNTMRQLEPFAGKHYFLPFERHFDDQHTRAARTAAVRRISRAQV